MTHPRYYRTEAVVLRQRPWGEADVILTLFTPNLGKLRAVARGARRTKSHLGGHVEPLTRVSLTLTAGQGLDIVTGAQAIDSHRRLREDLELVSSALYCAELTDAFVAEEQPVTPTYHLLRSALEWMESWPNVALLLRYFEFRLLDLSGYLPELYACVSCQAEVRPNEHAFSAAQGGVLCPACYNVGGRVQPLSLNALKVLRHFRRSAHQEVARLRLSDGLLAEIEAVLRSYTTFLLEREVNSARFLYRLKQLREQAAGADTAQAAGAPSV